MTGKSARRCIKAGKKWLNEREFEISDLFLIPN